MGSQITGQIVAVPGLQWTVAEDDSGAVAGPLFWIYVDKVGRWCLRKEGDETDAFFTSRAEALAFIRNVEGNAAYCLFIETDDGKVVLEQHGAAPLARRHERREGQGANAAPVAGESDGANASTPDSSALGRGLAWAGQLEQAARVSPSRTGLLSRRLRQVWS